MQKMKKELYISDLLCTLYIPENYEIQTADYPVVYVNGEAPVEEIIAELEKECVSVDFLFLTVRPQNWNDDFTPWKAPAFRDGEDAPKGNADQYIQKLIYKIKPYMDEHYRTDPQKSILLGYSLGGMTALYAMCKTDIFSKIGTLSGSLWYDGFIDFMENQSLADKECCVYLSLGKKESKSRNKRMAEVAECTERMKHLLEKKLGKEKVFFEWNNGGHFHEIPKRFAKALQWLLHS